MATRRGGETVSVRQYEFHKRYTHRLLAHPGYQALSFERKGIYTHLYDLAFCANDDGAIRIGCGDRFTRRRLVEFLAMQQAGPVSDPGACMAWAKQAVDALAAAELVKVDSQQIVWVVNYADEQERISPAGLRKRAQREREEHARGAGGDAPYIEEPGAGGPERDGLRPRRPVPTRPPCPGGGPPSRFDDPFDAGSDAPPMVGQSRDGHDQSQSQNQKDTYVSQNSESESDGRRFAGADAPARFDGRPSSGVPPPGQGGREDLYSMPIEAAAQRVTGEHGLWMANTVRKAVRDLGADVVWSVIGEVADARRDGLIKARTRDGRVTGGPLLNHGLARARERLQAREGVRQMAGGIGFSAGEDGR